jgi:geranylgeranyl diphosphate synthase type II
MNHPRIQLDSQLRELRRRIDARLDELVPDRPGSDPVVQSMRYSLLAPGKRLRPVMTMLAAAAFGGRDEKALDPGCAIEMVHAASLILDDMPSMDDAATRRGRPSNHRLFGEDVATLSAFALLNKAYAVVAQTEDLSSDARIDLVVQLTGAVGEKGIIAGQMEDLRSDRRTAKASEVEGMHQRKTGALFVAAVEIGARVAGVTEDRLEPIRLFAANFGLSFQALDDLIDQDSTPADAGKDVRKDVDKATFVSALGSERARSEAERFATAAARALDPVGPAGAPLAGLAQTLLDSARGSGSN